MKDNNPFPKGKVSAFKQPEKIEPTTVSAAQQYQDIKPRLHNLDSNVKNMGIEELRNLARDLKKVCTDKHQEMVNAEKKFKMESFKNHKYKADVAEYDKKNESTRIILTKRLIDKCTSFSSQSKATILLYFTTKTV